MEKKELIFKGQLKKELEKRELRASELARATGISKQVISDWLAGSRPKNIDQVKLVADFFGVTIDYLCFGGVDEITM